MNFIIVQFSSVHIAHFIRNLGMLSYWYDLLVVHLYILFGLSFIVYNMDFYGSIVDGRILLLYSIIGLVQY